MGDGMGEALSAAKFRARSRWRLACLCGIALWLLCAAGVATAQNSGPKSLVKLLNRQPPAGAPASPTTAPGAPQQPTAIPLPDVAARSEELKRMVRTASNQLPAPDQIESAKTTLDDRAQDLNTREKEVGELLSGTPNPMELREQEKYWRATQQETADLRRQLLEWANAAQSALQHAKALEPAWQATLQQNESTTGLGPTLDVIQQALRDLQHLDKQSQNQLKDIVNLQVDAAMQDQIADDTLDRLVRTREYLDRRLFQRDSRPLWQFQQPQQAESSEFYTVASARMISIRAFVVQARGSLALLFVLLLLSLFAARHLQRASLETEPNTPAQAELGHIRRHWFALGVLVPLLFGYLVAPSAPIPLIGLAILLSLIPILILLPPMIAPQFRTLLYCASGIYALSALVAWTNFSPFHKRQVHFVLDLATFAVFAYLVQPSRFKGSPDVKSHWLAIVLIRLDVALLGGATAANLFGFVKLGEFLGLLCLYSTFVAISMVTTVRVFTRVLLATLAMPAAQQLAVVRHYGSVIARWGPGLMKWSGVLLWLVITVNLLGLAAWVSDRIDRLRDFHIVGGTTSVTLGGVLGFFLILLVGYALSSGIRFLLREELLGRFHMARGVPELIASTIHYLLLLLVFLFAVNTGGVELNRFTVLTGALGVGVGFGLQNIVNNFISGLILQFERPIHVGDVLDIDGTNGTVTRIGIRASTVRTFQGAEVIIPNANFISGKVINWTLSNPQRRLELPVGVAYGSDVKLVSGLLERAATTHESVLTSPAPAVYFKEFGDSSLNFELQFWVMQESNTVKVKSDVAVAAWALLSEAGVEIPFPQRDLRLRAVDPEAAATLLSSNGSQVQREQHDPGVLFEPARRQRAGE
jgi:potassium efflux system protein